MKYKYYATIFKEREIYGVLFQDFPGCVSVGNDIDEALINANEALHLHLSSMIKDNDDIPKRTPREKIITNIHDIVVEIIVDI